MVNFLRKALFGVGCVAAAGAGASEFPVSVRMEAAAAWSDNLGRSSAPADRESSAWYHATVAASSLHRWAGGVVTISELAATLDTASEFSKFRAVTVGPQVVIRRKLGLGAFAPVLEGSASYVFRDARVTADDGWTAGAGLRVAKRITNTWRGSITGDWQQHDGKNATFDTSHHRLLAQVSWDPTSRLQLTYGAGRLWGSITANASPGVWSRALSGALGAKVFTYYNTVPWLPTELFGPGWVTYRVRARANFQWLELSPALGRNTSLPLRFERVSTTNIIGIKYRQEIWSLSLLHRF